MQADDGTISEAAALIRAGEVVSFPTETVYGLGADTFNETAVQKIFVAKGRPADNPLIVHITSLDDLDGVAHNVPDVLYKLADEFWPGALSLIVPKDDRVPLAVTAGLDTVAVRMPAHPCARALIMAAGTPIAAPSANLSGRPSPTTARHVMEDMSGRIPMILDGGSCIGGLESTVLDISGTTPVLLRPGLVTREAIEGVIGQPVALGAGVMQALDEGTQARSPGLLHIHYAPRACVTVVSGGVSRVIEAYRSSPVRTLILAPAEHLDAYTGCDVQAIGGLTSMETAAHMLFAALRQADEDGYDAVLFEALPYEGIGLAVMNRVLRAAGFHIID